MGPRRCNTKHMANLDGTPPSDPGWDLDGPGSDPGEGLDGTPRDSNRRLGLPEYWLGSQWYLLESVEALQPVVFVRVGRGTAATAPWSGLDFFQDTDTEAEEEAARRVVKTPAIAHAPSNPAPPESSSPAAAAPCNAAARAPCSPAVAHANPSTEGIARQPLMPSSSPPRASASASLLLGQSPQQRVDRVAEPLASCLSGAGPAAAPISLSHHVTRGAAAVLEPADQPSPPGGASKTPLKVSFFDRLKELD